MLRIFKISMWERKGNEREKNDIWLSSKEENKTYSVLNILVFYLLGRYNLREANLYMSIFIDYEAVNNIKCCKYVNKVTSNRGFGKRIKFIQASEKQS